MGFMMPRLQATNPSNAQRTPDQLNPWNPYFRTYGRVYPYGVSSTYEDPAPAPNWSHHRSIYSLLGQPVSNSNDCSIPFSTYRSNLFSSTSPHSSLVSRPRSANRHMRTPNRPTEQHLAVPNNMISIELSSDEDDLSSESVRALDGSDASSLSNHATRPLEIRGKLLNYVLPSTSDRKTPNDPKPFQFGKPKHSSRTDSVTSTDSIEAPPLNFCNRLKRTHHVTAQAAGANKLFRINNNINCSNRPQLDEQQSDESVDSSLAVVDLVDVKPILRRIDENNESNCTDNNNQNQDDATVIIKRVNIKREVKNEPNTVSDFSEDENETKVNICFASIKKE